MAAVATLPAHPAPFKLGNPNGQRQSVDAALLAARLRDLQLEFDNDNIEQQPASKHGASTRASYVPCSAAQVFAATTTRMPDEGGKDVKSAKPLPQRKTPTFTADGKPCVNPKQLQATLNLGMSESEAATSSAPIPARRLSETERQRHRHPKPSSPSALEKGDKPQRSASTLPYRPGDAAKRNAIARRSLQPQSQPQGKIMAVKHGSQTTYEREELLPSGPAFAPHEDHSHDVLHRPALKRDDRPNWTQQSQCGGDMHHLLWRHRAKAGKAKATDDDHPERRILHGNRPTRPQAPRQRSLNAIPEKLITDAVKQIKQEEKAKRRRSLVSFFKRS